MAGEGVDRGRGGMRAGVHMAYVHACLHVHVCVHACTHRVQVTAARFDARSGALRMSCATGGRSFDQCLSNYQVQQSELIAFAVNATELGSVEFPA